MFQEVTGNCGVDCLQKTANVHGLKLQGEFEVCEDRAAAKASQKSVNHDCKGGSQVPGERVYLDISSIKEENYDGSRFWVLVVDDSTDYYWRLFLKAMSDDR
jgi:hypothetical protein